MVTFSAHIDIPIVAKSQEEAIKKAEELLGNYENKKFDYVYLADVEFASDEL